MRQMDVLIAHPLKHHVFPLAAGIQRSGLSMKLIVPLYRKGFAAALLAIPGPIGRKARGYSYGALSNRVVISPFQWQIKRLMTRPADIVPFQAKFDLYVAKQIQLGNLRPKILVTMQDYMPMTVVAAKTAGAFIWSDQISNRSIEARLRVKRHHEEFGLASSVDYAEEINNAALAMANLVTAPSRYTLDGLVDRISSSAQVQLAPYGVAASQFGLATSINAAVLRVIARAHNVRKGGHLLLQAVENCAEKLRQIAGHRTVEIIIVGELEPILQKRLKELQLPEGFLVRSAVVPHADMPELLASADLFVMPALSEGMSLICIEAMQIGLPLVITKYCGIDCFRNMEMGIEVDDSVESLAQGLIYAFESMDRWPSWGAEARKAAGGLSWEAYELRVSEIAGGIE